MTPVARRTASANAFIDLNIQSLSPYRGLFGDVAAATAVAAATSPNSPRLRILTDCFYDYDFS